MRSLSLPTLSALSLLTTTQVLSQYLPFQESKLTNPPSRLLFPRQDSLCPIGNSVCDGLTCTEVCCNFGNGLGCNFGTRCTNDGCCPVQFTSCSGTPTCLDYNSARCPDDPSCCPSHRPYCNTLDGKAVCNDFIGDTPPPPPPGGGDEPTPLPEPTDVDGGEPTPTRISDLEPTEGPDDIDPIEPTITPPFATTRRTIGGINADDSTVRPIPTLGPDTPISDEDDEGDLDFGNGSSNDDDGGLGEEETRAGGGGDGGEFTSEAAAGRGWGVLIWGVAVAGVALVGL